MNNLLIDSPQFNTKIIDVGAVLRVVGSDGYNGSSDFYNFDELCFVTKTGPLGLRLLYIEPSGDSVVKNLPVILVSGGKVSVEMVALPNRIGGKMMDTKKLCIIIENAFIDPLDKVALLGAVQELEQYRSNPLANIQPCWKYVKQNGIKEQLDKITLEIAEVSAARGLRDMSMEIFDVLQGAVTLMYIPARKFNIDLFELVKAGQEKNALRGYYEK